MNSRQPFSAQKITALYERLSKDDDQSVSIENQKKILEKYAQDNGFRNTRHFVDDGVTGTVFSRPGLDAMIEEVKAGNVATVIIKDQSRIGRDVLEVGLLKRTFEENGVRFIAAEDGLDTAKGFNIMSIIRDVLNEFYVADTSQKIRAVLTAKGNDGKHLTNIAIYGYVKDPNDKEKNGWLIDPEAAAVIRRIFKMTIDGKGPSQIARTLAAEKVLRPDAYIAVRDGYDIPLEGSKYNWNTQTIANYIEKPEYMGHTVNFRTYNESYKNKKRIWHPKDEWLIFENTHPAIIDTETWETAQKCRDVKRRPLKRLGEPSMFSGIVYCSDCGRRMHNHRSADMERAQYESYFCPGSKTHECSRHSIRASTINALTLDAIRTVSGFVREKEDEFVQIVREMHNLQSTETVKMQQKQLGKMHKRHKELDGLIKQLYEDKFSGTLSAKRFEILSGEYETEQEALEQQIEKLQEGLADYEDENDNTGRFINLVHRYTDMPGLTATILNEYIDKIVVHETDRSSGRKEQRVDIYFNFIGQFTVPAQERETVCEERYDPKEHRRAQFRAYYYRNRERILANRAKQRESERATESGKKSA